MQNTEIIIDCDAPVFIPDGWSVLPDSEQLPNRVRGQFRFDPSRIILYLSDSQKYGNWPNGHKLRRELKSQRVLPLQVLDYLLKPENYISILSILPKWKGEIILFWGIIYLDSDNCPRVPFLGRNEVPRWSRFYGRLDGEMSHACLAACSQV